MIPMPLDVPKVRPLQAYGGVTLAQIRAAQAEMADRRQLEAKEQARKEQRPNSKRKRR